ncbi:hypothetical protein GCM10010470_07080 [Saccharopolyspora taberi]|uniref:AAA+ ATPase domain-containing protein n=1 Tax=Saccharopolyspora taberi TaxID=60895 RepID=A0ABN3V5B6_9PSEU
MRECVLRPKHHPDRDLPVVVLFGPRGSGKTALLGTIENRCGQAVPNARIDLDNKPSGSARAAVTRLAFDLSRKYENFGRIHFRRLMLCLLVVGAQLNEENRRKALAELRTTVAEDTAIDDRTRNAVNDVVANAAEAGLLPPWSSVAADLLLRGADSLRWRRRLRLGSGIGWPVEGKPVDLGDMWVDIGVADSGVVDEVFCAAFLADLREAYRKRRSARSRANCVVLLDNIDSEGGRQLLDILLDVRQRGEQGSHPLLLVCTSRQWDRRWGRQGVDAHTPEQAGLAAWESLRRIGTGRDSWWYPVELRDFTASEVAVIGRFATEAAPSPFVHALTGGHPWGTREVCAALGEQPTEPEMRLVFERRDDDGAALAVRAREYLLQDFNITQRRTLAVFAAAPDLELATRSAVRAAGTDDGIGPLREVRSRLWSGTDDDNRLSLHPWLRRLLLHELASRAEDDEESWQVVHARHRDHHRDQGNTAQSLYHALALEDLGAVVDDLRTRFERIHAENDVRPWVQRLDLITSAPNRISGDRAPRDRVEELVLGTVSPQDANLGRLVAAKWLLSDPLGDPGRSLHNVVRIGFERLAQQAEAGFVVLLAEAEKYA